jgi:hypothetical protein
VRLCGAGIVDARPVGDQQADDVQADAQLAISQDVEVFSLIGESTPVTSIDVAARLLRGASGMGDLDDERARPRV